MTVARTDVDRNDTHPHVLAVERTGQVTDRHVLPSRSRGQDLPQRVGDLFPLGLAVPGGQVQPVLPAQQPGPFWLLRSMRIHTVRALA